MPIVPPTKLAELQSNAANIRNVCVLAHVDHGKTTLSDALLATNGIISSRLAGKIRYLDSREDEQQRGITMESSGISLYYKSQRRKGDDCGNEEGGDGGGANLEYLINLIDSPGHVDFASEVASAARLSDGALVLVDVVEGVCTQTVSVLRQAWVENVRPILFLNKMDRLILEWRMTPNEAYTQMQQLIEQVNAVLAGFWEGDRLAEDSRKLEEAKEKWRETHGEDAPMSEWYLEEKDDSQIYFSPEQGNVLFGSAIDGWAFRVNHFAQIFAEKLGVPSPAKLQPLMWGDYFIDPKNKRRVLNRKQFSKLYGTAKASMATPLFVQLCLAPVWQVYESAVIDMDQEKIDKVVSALGIKILPRDRRSKDRRTLLTAIMQGWLPLAQACMAAVVEQLPSPVDAQPLRLPHLVQGRSQVSGNSEATTPKSKVEEALYECMAGTADKPVPLVAYIGKVVSIPRASLPEFSDGKMQRDRMEMTANEMRALGRDAVRRELALGRESSSGTQMSAMSLSATATPSSSGMATPLRPEPPSDVLVGFGRLYSGTISVGDKLWAMQPKYSAKNPKTHSFLKQVTIRALYMMMGRELVRLQSVPAGNICGIRGIAGAILKSGTLASDAQACPNLAAMHTETYPIVRVALEPMNPQDMTRLTQGLALLNQADPCVQVLSQTTGEHVLVTAGELHLERCLKDLRERFAQCEIHVSEPIVPFREGIARQSAQPSVVLGEVGSRTPRGEVSLTTANGLVTVTIQVEPLPEKTTKFLMRHEADIQRFVRLTSSQRRHRLSAAAEALDEDIGDTAKPSRLSELGPWLHSRIQQTFSRAKGWEPQRVEYAMSNGLRALGPRQTGPNMLVYSNKLQGLSSKPDSTAPAGGARFTNSIRDFEESINTGFQLAMQSGPLCLEPFAGVAVTIKELYYNGENADSTPLETNRTPLVRGAGSTAILSGQIITTVRDAIKMGFLHWSPRLHLAMYTCDIQATSDVLGKVYGVINRRRGRILAEEMREGTPYFIIKASIPIVESFGFADEIRKRTSGAAIPLLIFRGFEPLDTDPFWVPTTEEELEDLGEKADRDNVAKKYMDKVRKRKGLFVERKIVEHAEKQRTLKK
ncbi:P-loop containing nucleoside triphosphate hydrolase protein [Coemansia reversa NRRL 1564]|uniref:Ribosome assembly protein 1 n=1 Tax=Coemansia reversa (strain ATCC 12441 / NRRL 1564) TaxID=763665 RepID=A0A2G5BJQ2_COERN|nr:P-loop containing nucleoside triphosphate hydrolase protein [Coemansia reversa NRRL 1564]|eukprot:PIA19245.1 P-loop containing nucleoside triphosphate hydrolase protein [Coemansia reversa NRRL 1564]